MLGLVMGKTTLSNVTGLTKRSSMFLGVCAPIAFRLQSWNYKE